MRGMITPECPVCATPHEDGATTCAFCGVALAEPPAETATDAEAEATAEAETEIEAVPETPVEDAATTDAGIEAASEPEPEPEPPETEVVADTAKGEEIAGIPVDSAAPTPAAPLRRRTPSFATPRSAASLARQRTRRIEWGVAGGLAVLLLAQVIASDFDQLAAGATTRPWLQRGCAMLGCTLPPWREPRALRLLQRDVSANPSRPGLLRIRASFRNDARWAQPWPRLRVTLSDADGRMLATRAFVASEYLGKGVTANGIASGQVAGIAFDVVDPSPDVTAFTFGFE